MVSQAVQPLMHPETADDAVSNAVTGGNGLHEDENDNEQQHPEGSHNSGGPPSPRAARSQVSTAVSFEGARAQGSAVIPSRSLDEESALSAAEGDVAGPSRPPNNRSMRSQRPANSLISTAVHPSNHVEQYASSPKLMFRTNSVVAQSNQRSGRAGKAAPGPASAGQAAANSAQLTTRNGKSHAAAGAAASKSANGHNGTALGSGSRQKLDDGNNSHPSNGHYKAAAAAIQAAQNGHPSNQAGPSDAAGLRSGQQPSAAAAHYGGAAGMQQEQPTAMALDPRMPPVYLPMAAPQPVGGQPAASAAEQAQQAHGLFAGQAQPLQQPLQQQLAPIASSSQAGGTAFAAPAAMLPAAHSHADLTQLGGMADGAASNLSHGSHGQEEHMGQMQQQGAAISMQQESQHATRQQQQQAQGAALAGKLQVEEPTASTAGVIDAAAAQQAASTMHTQDNGGPGQDMHMHNAGEHHDLQEACGSPGVTASAILGRQAAAAAAGALLAPFPAASAAQPQPAAAQASASVAAHPAQPTPAGASEVATGAAEHGVPWQMPPPASAAQAQHYNAQLQAAISLLLHASAVVGDPGPSLGLPALDALGMPGMPLGGSPAAAAAAMGPSASRLSGVHPDAMRAPAAAAVSAATPAEQPLAAFGAAAAGAAGMMHEAQRSQTHHGSYAGASQPHIARAASGEGSQHMGSGRREAEAECQGPVAMEARTPFANGDEHAAASHSAQHRHPQHHHPHHHHHTEHPQRAAEVHPAASVHATVVAEGDESDSDKETSSSGHSGPPSMSLKQQQQQEAGSHATHGCAAMMDVDRVSAPCGGSISASPAPSASAAPEPAVATGPMLQPHHQRSPGWGERQAGHGHHEHHHHERAAQRDSNMAVALGAGRGSTRSGTVSGGGTHSGSVDMANDDGANDMEAHNDSQIADVDDAHDTSVEHEGDVPPESRPGRGQQAGRRRGKMAGAAAGRKAGGTAGQQGRRQQAQEGGAGAAASARWDGLQAAPNNNNNNNSNARQEGGASPADMALLLEGEGGVSTDDERMAAVQGAMSAMGQGGQGLGSGSAPAGASAGWPAAAWAAARGSSEPQLPPAAGQLLQLQAAAQQAHTAHASVGTAGQTPALQAQAHPDSAAAAPAGFSYNSCPAAADMAQLAESLLLQPPAQPLGGSAFALEAMQEAVLQAASSISPWPPVHPPELRPKSSAAAAGALPPVSTGTAGASAAAAAQQLGASGSQQQRQQEQQQLEQEQQQQGAHGQTPRPQDTVIQGSMLNPALPATAAAARLHGRADSEATPQDTEVHGLYAMLAATAAAAQMAATAGGAVQRELGAAAGQQLQQQVQQAAQHQPQQQQESFNSQYGRQHHHNAGPNAATAREARQQGANAPGMLEHNHSQQALLLSPTASLMSHGGAASTQAAPRAARDHSASHLPGPRGHVNESEGIKPRTPDHQPPEAYGRDDHVTGTPWLPPGQWLPDPNGAGPSNLHAAAALGLQALEAAPAITAAAAAAAAAASYNEQLLAAAAVPADVGQHGEHPGAALGLLQQMDSLHHSTALAASHNHQMGSHGSLTEAVGSDETRATHDSHSMAGAARQGDNGQHDPGMDEGPAEAEQAGGGAGGRERGADCSSDMTSPSRVAASRRRRDGKRKRSATDLPDAANDPADGSSH